MTIKLVSTDMGIVNTDDIKWESLEKRDTVFKRKKLAEAAGSEQIGCSLYEIPPGQKAWPYHYHTANEEAMFVLSGSGTLRLDDEMTSIREGEYVTFPTDERGGHRVINDSEETLTYLMISTMIEPDVTVYPDSEKFGVYVGSPPGGEGKRDLHGYYSFDSAVDYWIDEEDTEKNE
jgi:uncharacterized cupin superfamily protein